MHGKWRQRGSASLWCLWHCGLREFAVRYILCMQAGCPSRTPLSSWGLEAPIATESFDFRGLKGCSHGSALCHSWPRTLTTCLGESEAGSRGGGLGFGSAGRVAAESWNVANDFADERLVLNALRPPWQLKQVDEQVDVACLALCQCLRFKQSCSGYLVRTRHLISWTPFFSTSLRLHARDHRNIFGCL